MNFIGVSSFYKFVTVNFQLSSKFYGTSSVLFKDLELSIMMLQWQGSRWDLGHDDIVELS